MSLQSLRQWSWLRTAIAALLLCFALGTVAYAGHNHKQNTANASVACDFCTSLSNLVDAPPQTRVTDSVHVVAAIVAVPKTAFIALRSVSVAQARAPPVG